MSPAPATSEEHPAVPEFARAARKVVAPFEPPQINPPTVIMAHPIVWAILGTSIFLAAWLFPPNLYTRMFGDRSFMFLDLPTFYFSMACIGCTIAGIVVGLTGKLNSAEIEIVSRSPMERAPLTSYGVFVVLTLMNLGAIYLFVRIGGLAVFKAALQGDASFIYAIEKQAESGGLSGKLWINMTTMSSVVFPVLWLTSRSSRPYSASRWMFYAFAFTYLVAAMMGAKRNFVARPLFAMLMIYIVWPGRRLTRQRAISVCLGAALIVIAVFVAASALRSDVRDAEHAISELLRYLLCPFNTEALIVNEVLVMPGSGAGGYWSSWIWNFPIISDIFDMESLRYSFFGEQTLMGVDERAPLLLANNISTGTNLTAFGESYTDFGMLGCFPFFLVGWAGGILWKRFLRGTLLGLLLYPQFAYSMLEWRANIIFPSSRTNMAIVAFVLIGICLWIERPRSSGRGIPARPMHRFRADGGSVETEAEAVDQTSPAQA